MGSFAEFLRTITGRARPHVEPPRGRETLAEFTERAADTMRTLRPSWTTQIERDGLLRISGPALEAFDVRHAYAYHLSTGEPAGAVLAATIAMTLVAGDMPATPELLIPCLRPASWLAAAEASAAQSVPSVEFTQHLRTVPVFACEGARRFATSSDLQSIELTVLEATARAHRNVLDRSGVGLELLGAGEASVWVLRAESALPTAVLSGGTDALREVTAASGIADPVCALSSDREVFVADLAAPGAIGALLATARPFGRPVPPNSLGGILVAIRDSSGWTELSSPSAELFSSLAPELDEIYPDATVVRPTPKHDGHGTSYWVAEWRLRRGRFVLPAAADILLVSPSIGPKRRPTLPRKLNDVLTTLSAIAGTPHACKHYVVEVDDPKRAYRMLEKLPLVELNR